MASQISIDSNVGEPRHKLNCNRNMKHRRLACEMMSLMSDSPPLGPCRRALPRYFTLYIQLPQAIKSIDVYFGKYSITILYLTVLVYLICLRAQL
jgi:hypothetical protein